jgi:hypothetical protein
MRDCMWTYASEQQESRILNPEPHFGWAFKAPKRMGATT